jgi:hypothetical protein
MTTYLNDVAGLRERFIAYANLEKGRHTDKEHGSD